MRSSVVYVRNNFRTLCCRRLVQNRHLFRHHHFLLQLDSTDELRDAQNHNLISLLLCSSRCSLIMTLMTMLTSLAPEWQVNRQRLSSTCSAWVCELARVTKRFSNFHLNAAIQSDDRQRLLKSSSSLRSSLTLSLSSWSKFKLCQRRRGEIFI